MIGLKEVNYHIETVPDECKVSSEMKFHHLPVPYLQRGIERWVHLGIPPGDFLKAVICNDLRMAVMYADDTNRECLVGTTLWFYNNVPSLSWGNLKNAIAWQENRLDALKMAIEIEEKKQ